MRLLSFTLLIASGCGAFGSSDGPGLPARSSPVLVPTDPPFVDLPFFAELFDQADDDPAWWGDVGDQAAVFTRQGQLTAALDASGPLRAFDDGTVVFCSTAVNRWDGASWASQPLPALPDLVGDGQHRCTQFVADPAAAWLLVSSGHLCRYDGGFDCADVSTTIMAPPEVGPSYTESLALANDTVFATHSDGFFTTEIYAGARGAPAASVGMITTIDGLVHGDIERLIAVAGRDEVVTQPTFNSLRQNPLVIGREGVVREIDVAGLGQDGDQGLAVNTSITTMDAGTFVIANRRYDDGTCDEVDDCQRWSEMVVLRERDGETVEVGHLGVVGDEVPDGYAVRVDGELRIMTYEQGWYRLGE